MGGRREEHETDGPVAAGRGKPLFLIGDVSGPKWEGICRELGWHRMFVARIRQPWPGERWGLDNGAYGAWKDQKAWDEAAYLERLDRALQLPSRPYLAVVPDKPADPDSLAFSLAWRERLRGYPFPWYLALQDGMTPEQVAPVAALFDGLFLGGTSAFKSQADLWCRFAHARGLPFHYARCGTSRKLRIARRIGADSADSTGPIKSWPDFVRFRREWLNTGGQLALPIDPEGG